MEKILKYKMDYFLIFFFAFLFFLFLQSAPVLPDPDGFYHAKMTEMISKQGIVQDFPYLQFTTLKDGYIDQHFLYHLILIPSLLFSDHLIGIKCLQALINSVFIFLFYWLLKKEKIKIPLFWTIILITSSPFIFRISLIKANSLSLIFLFLGIFFIFNKKYLLLFVLSYFYVWAYGGWPLMLVLAFVFVFSQFLNKKIQRESVFRKFCSRLDFLHLYKQKQKIDFKLIIICLSGIILGLVLNPYFYKNFYFYYQQIIQIGLINYQDKINVGGEWYAYPFFELAQSSLIVFFIFLIALFLFLISIKNQNAKSVSLLILSFFFLALTLKSRRYVEYLIPFLVFTSAFIITFSLKDNFVRDICFLFSKFYKNKKIAFYCSAIFLIFVFSVVTFKEVKRTKQELSFGSNLTLYKNSAEYLQKYSFKKDIIFHADWDDFPSLFYYNNHNYYILGLDPTFMYKYDKQLYDEYARITTGEDSYDLYKKIKYDFNAKFVFFDKNHLALKHNLMLDNRFVLVYQDEEAEIYEIE
ncbi:MAG: hypothetical protein U9O55_02305 [Patescibacteria group bacterium]|nr:hypothetical protein [Patescibacteria group bacterium]